MTSVFAWVQGLKAALESTMTIKGLLEVPPGLPAGPPARLPGQPACLVSTKCIPHLPAKPHFDLQTWRGPCCVLPADDR